MIVVDASVAVKWFLPEPGEDEAGKLLSGEELLAAPSLIRLEVTGAMIRRFREGQLAEQHAREAVEAWESMLRRRVIRLIPDSDFFAQAVELAFYARHTLSDCLYLAVAKQLEAQLVTADVPMHERGQRAYKRIALLATAKKH